MSVVFTPLSPGPVPCFFLESFLEYHGKLHVEYPSGMVLSPGIRTRNSSENLQSLLVLIKDVLIDLLQSMHPQS